MPTSGAEVSMLTSGHGIFDALSGSRGTCRSAFGYTVAQRRRRRYCPSAAYSGAGATFTLSGFGLCTMESAP